LGAVNLLNKTRIDDLMILIQFLQLNPQILNQSVQFKNKLIVELISAVLEAHVNISIFYPGQIFELESQQNEMQLESHYRFWKAAIILGESFHHKRLLSLSKMVYENANPWNHSNNLWYASYRSHVFVILL